MTEQLDAGIRFIDFRIVRSAPPAGNSSSKYDWFCLHMMETHNRALTYLAQAKEWLLQ